MPHKPKVYFLNKDGHNTDVELTADVFQTANIKRVETDQADAEQE